MQPLACLKELGTIRILPPRFKAVHYTAYTQGSHVLGGARRTVEDVKSDLIPEEVDETHLAIKNLKREAHYGASYCCWQRW